MNDLEAAFTLMVRFRLTVYKDGEEWKVFRPASDADPFMALEDTRTSSADILWAIFECVKKTQVRGMRELNDALVIPKGLQARVDAVLDRAEGEPTEPAIRPTEEAANAFWRYWKRNGIPHVHGFYESTWGAINAALRTSGVVQHRYGSTLKEMLDSGHPPQEGETVSDEPILCSACFDDVGAERILAMIPQSTCERCGKKCLGYQTAEIETPAAERKE